MNIGARVHTEGRLFTARRARTAFSVLENQGCWPDIQGCQSLIFESLRFFFNFFFIDFIITLNMEGHNCVGMALQ